MLSFSVSRGTNFEAASALPFPCFCTQQAQPQHNLVEAFFTLLSARLLIRASRFQEIRDRNIFSPLSFFHASHIFRHYFFWPPLRFIMLKPPFSLLRSAHFFFAALPFFYFSSSFTGYFLLSSLMPFILLSARIARSRHFRLLHILSSMPQPLIARFSLFDFALFAVRFSATLLIYL